VAAALFAEAVLAEGGGGMPLGTVLVSEQLVAAGLSFFFHPASAFALGSPAEVSGRAASLFLPLPTYRQARTHARTHART
jgi:hypothetical protein